MKNLLLIAALLLVSQLTHAGLSRRLTKADVGLSSAIEMVFADVTIPSGAADTDILEITTLPANARIVQLALKGFAGGCALTLILGVDGDEASIYPGYMVDENQTITIPSGVKYSTQKTIQAKISGFVPSGCYNVPFKALLQYVQE